MQDCGFEMLFLPLRHFGKTHSRILGIMTRPARSRRGSACCRSDRSSCARYASSRTSRAALAWQPNRMAVGAPLFGEPPDGAGRGG